MGENILIIFLGTIFGFVMTAITAIPIWLTLLIAFLTGFFLYIGKEIGIQIVKYIKNKFK